MTHFFQRSALILLATTSLSAALCASPAFSAVHHRATHKAEAPPTAANGKIVTEKGERASYVVKKGDTLEKIADQLDTTVDELMKTNKLKKTSVLQPGDVLKGPVVTKKAYVVTKGDTVFSIAKRFHVTVEQLREENDLSPKTSIRPGQQIRLPADYRAPAVEAANDQADKADAESAKPTKGHKGKAPPATASDETPPSGGGTVTTREAKGESYKAKKGDTLAKIADHLDTDIGTLKRLNHVKGSAVHAGQVYRGPSFAEHIYTAQAGDTLASIAGRFGVSVASLRAENELSKRVLSVRSGQKIFLPEGFHDREASPAERPTSSRGDRSEHYPTIYPPGRGEPALPAHPIPYAGHDAGRRGAAGDAWAERRPDPAVGQGPFPVAVDRDDPVRLRGQAGRPAQRRHQHPGRRRRRRARRRRRRGDLRRRPGAGFRQPDPAQARRRLGHGLCPPFQGRGEGPAEGDARPGDRPGRQQRRRTRAAAPLRGPLSAQPGRTRAARGSEAGPAAR